jgi:hypothetical protein
MDFESDQRKTKLTKLLKKAAAVLEKNPESVPEHMYKTLEAATSLFYVWRRAHGAPGWSKGLKDEKGLPFFTDKEAEAVESGFRTIEHFFERDQKGGGEELPLAPGGDLVKVPLKINPEDVSIDKAYYTFKKTIGDYSTQWKEIAESLGIVEAIESGPDITGIIPTPAGPVPFMIPRKSILPFVSSCIELLRLWLSLMPIDLPMYRFFVSFIQLLLDAIRGDAKQAIFSLVGLFSQSGLMISVAGRFVVNVFDTMPGDVREELMDTTFKSTKAVITGFVLWAFSVLSPDALRVLINESFTKMREVAEGLNEKIKGLQEKATASVPKGVKITFPTIPLEKLPSMEDIENLQMIARVPELYCSKEFQDIMKPLLAVPPLRLVLDLANLPTVKEDLEERCGDLKDKSLTDTAVELAKPKIEVEPLQLPQLPTAVPKLGGTRKKRHSVRRHARRMQHTRRKR